MIPAVVLIPAVATLLAALVQRDHHVSSKERKKLAQETAAAIEEVHLLVNSRLDAVLAEVVDLKAQLALEKTLPAEHPPPPYPPEA